MKKRILYIVFILISNFTFLNAQIDSIIFNNGNVIVGELKEMGRGVLTIETNYSDSDFKIEWDGVEEIYTESVYLIDMSNNTRYKSNLISVGPDKIRIVDEGDTIEVNLLDIVYLKSIDAGFWSQLYASIDLGYSFTKASNLNQISARSNIGFLAEKWSADASYNTLFSTQDNVEDIRRTDGGLTYKLNIFTGWFLFSQLSFLSNTEQKLDLRTNLKLGLGKYLVQTNKVYWGLQGGGSFNIEKFSTDAGRQESFEAFIGTELNLFDIGDLNLLTKANAYPSFTDSGRWRADFVFDLKYDMPLDFYTKLGLTYNYDNRPVEGASESDYVFQFTFGWEL